jgi:hypothetical protein
VTIPAGVTVAPNAKLYVWFSGTTGGQATPVNSPAVGSNNPFTVNVPLGSGYFLAFLDQNNDGELDTGDVSSLDSLPNGLTLVTISGSGTQNISLSNAGTFAWAYTAYYKVLNSSSTLTGHAVEIDAGAHAKQPVAVELTAASNPNVLTPVDVPNDGSAEFLSLQDIYSDALNVGDTYTLAVKYSDGTSENVNAVVKGWNGTSTPVGPSALATNLLPSGTTGPSAGSRTQPTFTWTYPSGASTAGDSYLFNLSDASNNEIWSVPQAGSFLYSDVPGASLTWNIDPLFPTNTATVPSLTSGKTYYWYLAATDSNENAAFTMTSYQP